MIKFDKHKTYYITDVPTDKLEEVFKLLKERYGLYAVTEARRYKNGGCVREGKLYVSGTYLYTDTNKTVDKQYKYSTLVNPVICGGE